jgi:hypothetical protein
MGEYYADLQFVNGETSGPGLTDGFEDDDVQGQAKLIDDLNRSDYEYGAEQERSIFPAGDKDWLKFEAPRVVGMACIQLSQLYAGGADLDFTIYTSSGEALASGYSDRYFNNVTGRHYGSACIFNRPADTYYIEVVPPEHLTMGEYYADLQVKE